MLDMAAPPGIEALGDLNSLTPEAAQDALRILATDWWHRIASGTLYKIKTKDEADEDGEGGGGFVVPFRPNFAQRRLLLNLHNKNLILKARQLGFTTLIQVMGLDHALWIADQNVAVIAHTEDDAEVIFRDKIRFAYDNLPAPIRSLFPLRKATESQLIFDHNGSSIRVATSTRSGTVHFLHVSEFGKIAATRPDKAREMTTGSLQAVPTTGMAFIESTAEGQEGAFYEMARRAEAKWRQAKPLTPVDYRFHFFPWWRDPQYCLSDEDARRITITLADHDYFDGVEDETGTTLSLGQRAWYIAKRDEEFAAEPDLMWREYPSTPEEPWKSTSEGRYLYAVIRKARSEGRIGDFPHVPGLPVYGFWDIGASDTTTLWVMQAQGQWDTWIDYREANGEGFLPFLSWIDERGYQIGAMYLPHDAAHARQGIEDVTSLVSQLREIRPSWTWHVVPRVANIQHGIDMLRTDFAAYRFHEAATKQGLTHLENYKRQWNVRLATWGAQPQHDDASHAADAIRQKAQALPHVELLKQQPGAPKRRRPRATGLTA